MKGKNTMEEEIETYAETETTEDYSNEEDFTFGDINRLRKMPSF